jgi:hypothetical protein
VRRALAAQLPEHESTPLSRLAIWAVASVPGVTAALVGMRREPYVSELRPLLAEPPLAQPERVFSSVERARSND